MVKVCDAIMGSGKSSAAITYMNEHSDRKFIYITPYLDEADRIKVSCPELNFVAPSRGLAEYGFTKGGHTMQLLRDGRNITTTHQAFSYYTEETLELIRNGGYSLIIDECIQILENVEAKNDDLDFLFKSGMFVNDGDEYRVKDFSYNGDLFNMIFRIAQSRTLVRVDKNKNEGELFYWMLPPELVTSFADVIVMTYMFDGQDMRHFFDIYNIEYSRIGVVKCADGKYRFSDTDKSIPEYTGHLAEKIHILDNPKMNAIGDDKFDLSLNWHNTHKDKVEQLRKNIQNYFQNILRDIPSEDRMWGTFSSARMKLRGAGYSKRFVAFNERATNKYKNCRALVYAVNVFPNTSHELFYKKRGVEVDRDAYALSNMVQWIWRSAIRDGEEVWIYIPSRRMRELLIKWIADVEEEYRRYAAENKDER